MRTGSPTIHLLPDRDRPSNHASSQAARFGVNRAPVSGGFFAYGYRRIPCESQEFVPRGIDL
jgi:hypothetical protein